MVDHTAGDSSAETLAALRESEARFRVMFDCAVDGILVANVADRTFMMGNRAMAAMLMCRAEDISSLRVDDIHPRKDLPQVLEHFERLARGDSAVARDIPVKRADGSIVYCDIAAAPMTFAGKPHLMGVFHDVSERRRNEEVLRETARRIRAVSDNITNGMIYQVVRKPDGTRVFTYLGEAVKRLYGVTPEEGMADSSRIYGRVHRDDLDRIIAEEEEADRTLRVFRSEARMFNPDGSIRWSAFVSNPRRLEDGSTCWDGIEFDITERKRMEEERLVSEQRIQQLQKLDSLGLLAGGLAHDFNNLLGGIFGYISMGQDFLREGRLDDAAEAMMRAMSVFDRAKGLTNQLLTFSRGGSPVSKPVQTAPMIERNARFALSGSNVACRFEGMDNLWMCDCDEVQIAQVIDNIVINAQQAMPAGGVLTITARNIGRGAARPAALAADREYVEVSFADTGVGIPANILPRIFEPFFTTKTKGHGLGLATCHSIVRQHGGVIEVESKPGAGSVFKVYLPAASAASGIARDTPAGWPDHHSEGHVLVMDDEPYLRKVLGLILKNMGYTVMVAKDGAEVLRVLARVRNGGVKFSAILLDITVPGGMGGREAAAEIRRQDADVPIIAVSGYSDDPVMKRPREFGFTDTLGKPFRRQDLSALMERLAKRAGGRVTGGTGDSPRA